MNYIAKGVLVLLATALTACGPVEEPATTATPVPVNAVISYNITNKSGLPLGGLQFKATMPAGVTIATDPGTKNVKEASLVTGSALAGLNANTFGNYSTPYLKLVVMANDANALQSGVIDGELFKVHCEFKAATPSDISITLDKFTSINAGEPIKYLIGYSYDQSTKAETNISPSLKIAVTAKLK